MTEKIKFQIKGVMPWKTLKEMLEGADGNDLQENTMVKINISSK